MNHEAHRRYRILGLLGKGGHGRVYLARLETDGFSKEVAIKLLREDQQSEAVLCRFRDEARFLGLIRDRAIVAVDAPVRLNGQWAVVMEYVQGCTLARLLRAHGPVPPSVALEIVLEIARALDKVYHHPGPNGEPLQMLHRDIKPGNIQLTAYGEVKLLDFGIARAELVDREAKTRNVIMGTGAYIAPERFDGLEAPAGDVYSLGVVLEELLLGRRGKDRPRLDPSALEDDPSLAGALQLAEQMTRRDPQARPTARDVEHRSEVLLDAFGRTQSLRTFSERVVPQHSKLAQDDLSGSLLSESHTFNRDGAALLASALTEPTPRPAAPHLPVEPASAEPPPTSSRRRGLLKFAGVGLFGLILGIGGLLLGSGSVATVVYLAQSDVTQPGTDDLLSGRRERSTLGALEGEEPQPTAPDEEADLPTWSQDVAIGTAATSSTSDRLRPDLILGRGRSVVIEVPERPTALRASPDLTIVPLPPHVVLSGRRQALATFALEHRGGELSWAVEIRERPETVPEGELSFIAPELLALPVGAVAVCDLSGEPTASVLPEPDALKIEPLGGGQFYLQPLRQGWFDAVFQLPDGPRVLALAAQQQPPEDATPPDGCVVSTSTLQIPVGGELVMPTGFSAQRILVSEPRRIDAKTMESDPEKLVIRALHRGTVTLVASHPEHPPWIRDVQIQ